MTWVLCCLPSPSHDSGTVQILQQLVVFSSQFTVQLDVIKLIFSVDGGPEMEVRRHYGGSLELGAPTNGDVFEPSE